MTTLPPEIKLPHNLCLVEVARAFGVSPPAMYRALQTGRCPGVQPLGGRWMIPASWVVSRLLDDPVERAVALDQWVQSDV